MPVAGSGLLIHEQVLLWPGITSGPHRFGGTEYRLGRREIGHIHGDALVDIPFPMQVRDEVVNGGLAKPHHHVPNSGWVSCYLRQADDVERALGLLRRSYDIAVATRRIPDEGGAGLSAGV